MTNTENDTKELTITRTFNAPRELVWKVWTEADHLKNWWAPKGFSNPVCDWNPFDGSKILIHMKAPDGVVYPMDGEFQEVINMQKLVFTSAALDINGGHLFEILNTISFEEDGRKTKVTLHFIASKITQQGTQHVNGMEMGWNLSLDKLSNYLNH